MSSVQQSDIDEWLQEGLRHYAVSDPARALEAWYRVLDVEPKNARALEYIGYVRKNFRVEVKHPALEPMADATAPAIVPLGTPPSDVDVPEPPELHAASDIAVGDGGNGDMADGDVPAPPALDVADGDIGIDDMADGDVPAPPAFDAATDTAHDDVPEPPALETVDDAAQGDVPAPPALDSGGDDQMAADVASSTDAGTSSSWGALVGAALGQPAPPPIDTSKAPEPLPEPTPVFMEEEAAQAAQAALDSVDAEVLDGAVLEAADASDEGASDVGDDAVVESSSASDEDASEVGDDAVVEAADAAEGAIEVDADAVIADPLELEETAASFERSISLEAASPASADEDQIGLVGSAFGKRGADGGRIVDSAPSVPDAITIPPVTVEEAPKVVRYQTYEDAEDTLQMPPATRPGAGEVDSDPAPTDAPAASVPFEELAAPTGAPSAPTGEGVSDAETLAAPTAAPTDAETSPAPDVKATPEPAAPNERGGLMPSADVFEIWGGGDDNVVDLADSPVEPSIFDELLTPTTGEDTPQADQNPVEADQTRAPVVHDSPEPAAVPMAETVKVDLESECDTLMEGARELFALGDFSGSLELVEKALAIDAKHPAAIAYLDKNKATLLTMYESRLGSLESAPKQLTTPDEVMWMNLHHRAGFMLAQVDGALTYEDLAAVSGMSRFETFRILAELKQNGVID